MSFINDQLEDVCTFSLLNVIDGFNRKASGMKIVFSLPSGRVILEFKQILLCSGSLK